MKPDPIDREDLRALAYSLELVRVAFLKLAVQRLRVEEAQRRVLEIFARPTPD